MTPINGSRRTIPEFINSLHTTDYNVAGAVRNSDDPQGNTCLFVMYQKQMVYLVLDIQYTKVL